MDLSVIVAARDEADTIEAQLDALLAQEWDGEWEIVVADNGSTDGTDQIVGDRAAKSGRLRLVAAAERAGAGHARNVAMASSCASAFAFCDADDLVEPGWVATMGEQLRGFDSVAGKIGVDALNPEWLQQAYYRETPDNVERWNGIFPFSSSCNLGVTRDAIDSVGAFDEAWRTGQDVELCLRLWLAGRTMTFAPGAVVQYRYRSSWRALWRRSRQYGAVAPAIAFRLDKAGRESPSRLGGVRQWVWLVRHLPMVRTRAGRARWWVVAATRVGRLSGSVRARRLML